MRVPVNDARWSRYSVGGGLSVHGMAGLLPVNAGTAAPANAEGGQHEHPNKEEMKLLPFPLQPPEGDTYSLKDARPGKRYLIERYGFCIQETIWDDSVQNAKDTMVALGLKPDKPDFGICGAEPPECKVWHALGAHVVRLGADQVELSSGMVQDTVNKATANAIEATYDKAACPTTHGKGAFCSRIGAALETVYYLGFGMLGYAPMPGDKQNSTDVRWWIVGLAQVSYPCRPWALVLAPSGQMNPALSIPVPVPVAPGTPTPGDREVDENWKKLMRGERERRREE